MEFLQQTHPNLEELFTFETVTNASVKRTPPFSRVSLLFPSPRRFEERARQRPRATRSRTERRPTDIMLVILTKLVPGAFLAGAAQPATPAARSGVLTCAIGTRAQTASQEAVVDEAPARSSEHAARWASPTPSVVHGAIGSSVLDSTDRVIGRRPPKAQPLAPAAPAPPMRAPMPIRTPRGDDPVKWYLQNIGKQRLLTPDEVNALARRIQQLIQWQALREEMDARMERDGDRRRVRGCTSGWRAAARSTGDELQCTCRTRSSSSSPPTSAWSSRSRRST